MSGDIYEFSETTKFNVIKEYAYYFSDISPHPEKHLKCTHIQRKSHNGLKNKWVIVWPRGSSCFSGAKIQDVWDYYVIDAQKTKDVEDYIRETGSILGLL